MKNLKKLLIIMALSLSLTSGYAGIYLVNVNTTGTTHFWAFLGNETQSTATAYPNQWVTIPHYYTPGRLVIYITEPYGANQTITYACYSEGRDIDPSLNWAFAVRDHTSIITYPDSPWGVGWQCDQENIGKK
jgi:hypothetical protein